MPKLRIQSNPHIGRTTTPLITNNNGGITIGNNMLAGCEIKDNIFDELGTPCDGWSLV